MNGAILDFNLLLGKEAQMGFYFNVQRRCSLLSGCRNLDRIDFISPLLFLCGFLNGHKNRLGNRPCRFTKFLKQ